MPIGNVPGAAQLNFQAGAVAVQLREAALAAKRLADYVNLIGAAGLTDAGFDNDDATAFLELISSIGMLSGIYFGTQVLTSTTDFSAMVQSIAGPS